MGFAYALNQAMPKYSPIDAGVTFDCDESDLLSIRWEVECLVADFLLPATEKRSLRVRFDGATIVRLLDEMPLSTEEQPTRNEGLVPRHFAYRVDGAVFADAQSATWKKVHRPVQHYQFITGWGCMDVLSGVEPSFEIVELEK
ncbi:hypothetical protein [Bradyrhizobium sp. ERR14]|uniref:hypothetical protein n=1 Tax=Bradyrhizobium sp. ERR14 TaxID=2663837 RepID=UPI001619321B|nr:hypothetical protein [Bradyrhizobium sp. ERR14]MBB4394864.1 hypothetical protein [Bradyrhizobium sp. ERR14]